MLIIYHHHLGNQNKNRINIMLWSKIKYIYKKKRGERGIPSVTMRSLEHDDRGSRGCKTAGSFVLREEWC